ncbi:diguanylate cyclase [bacterium]|nr:diguanylate cyclase [bacterium]
MNVVEQEVRLNREEYLLNLVLVGEVGDINASLSLVEACLGEEINKIGKTLHLKLGSILLIGKEDDGFKIKANKGLDEEISDWVTGKNISLLVEDIEKGLIFSKEGVEKHYPNSLLSLPLKIGREVVGILNVNHKVSRETFNKLNLEILTLFCNQIPTIIEKSWLYKKTKKEVEKLSLLTNKLKANKKIISKVNKLLDKSLYDLTIINEVVEAGSSSLGLVECAGGILKSLNEIIDFTIAGIFIIDENQETQFLITINSPVGDKYIECLEKETIREFDKYFGIKKLIYSQENLIIIKEEQRSLIVKDVGVKLNSYQSIKLKFSQNLKGLLCISHKDLDSFTPEEIRLIKLIAKYASLSLENAILYQKIELSAVTDELTKLYNYRYFNNKIEEELLRAERYQKKFSLIMMDIDNFRNINNCYGHQQGDLVLKTVAKIMKFSLRKVNILARYGGEEFVIILPESNKKMAKIAGERLRKNIEKHEFPLLSGEGILRLTASMGIAEYYRDGRSENQLVKKADQALYQAKAKGKNKICFASLGGEK